MLKGACYVRVSTDNQLENYSIEEQSNRLRSYCKAKDISIEGFYTDGGFSGSNINRPGLQRMLSDIDAGKIDVVVVYKLDRLSRSQKDTLMLIEDKFIANHVGFISINENFDTTTPFGRAMIGILSVFAQLEKDQITERFTMGRIGRAKNGFYHGGPSAPTGYDYTNGRLVVNEYEALQVQDLYERFAQGYTVHNCWLYMQKKYITKYGAWTSETSVRNILRNDVYIGMVKFKGKSYKGNHEPIITPELFETVQGIFHQAGRSQTSFTRLPFKANTLLSGLLYCGRCGARYHGEHGSYSCYSRTKSHKKYVTDPDCKNKKWNINKLDSYVLEQLSRLTFEETADRKEPSAKRDYTGRLAAIDQQVSNLTDLYQIGGISKDTISNKIMLLTKEKHSLLNNLAKLSEMESKTDDILFKNKFLDFFTNAELPEKRSCLANLIEKIIVNDDKIDIILK